MISECRYAFHILLLLPPFIRSRQLFEAQMRCAITEAETREDVMEEMEERMRNMEKRYLKRITDEVQMNEMKMDAKIDMLHRTGLLGSGEAAGGEEEDFVSRVLAFFAEIFSHSAVE